MWRKADILSATEDSFDVGEHVTNGSEKEQIIVPSPKKSNKLIVVTNDPGAGVSFEAFRTFLVGVGHHYGPFL
jgi:hypothetical protein